MAEESVSALVAQKGTPEVRERLAAGVLPDEELEHAVREILFEPIADAPRWRKISKAKIARRAREQGYAASEDDVVFDKVAADVFTASEWATLKKLKECLPEAEVEAFWIVATCGVYERRFTKAAVRIMFAGRQYVREVVL